MDRAPIANRCFRRSLSSIRANCILKLCTKTLAFVGGACAVELLLQQDLKIVKYAGGPGNYLIFVIASNNWASAGSNENSYFFGTYNFGSVRTIAVVVGLRCVLAELRNDPSVSNCAAPKEITHTEKLAKAPPPGIEPGSSA